MSLKQRKIKYLNKDKIIEPQHIQLIIKVTAVTCFNDHRI